jgi:phosphoribosylformylglycinamidine cyclo-ligase
VNVSPTGGEPGSDPRSTSAYQAAGVNIDEGMRAVARIRQLVRTTYTPRVEGEVGAFAGFFAFPTPASDRLLVASMDGVGTKLKLAALAGAWRGVGYDIVSHCVNDILVHGATPLFFLDYIGAGRLKAEIVGELVEGMTEACRESHCALIGGETAEMPGMYPPGELDLVGTIVGEVRRADLIDGKSIRAGDLLLGLASSGLHTNGYSLARRVLNLDDHPANLDERLEGEEETLGQLLLRRHRMYLPALRPLLEKRLLRGLAHITGGGILDNLPRILPPQIRGVVRREAWEIPPLFRMLGDRGGITPEECYRVLNMGIGMILVVRPGDVREVCLHLDGVGEPARVIGWCEVGPPGVRFAGDEEISPS